MDPVRGLIHLGLKTTETALDRALDVIRLADTLLVATAVPPVREQGSEEPVWPEEEQADLDAMSATLRARKGAPVDEEPVTVSPAAAKSAAPRKTAAKRTTARKASATKKSAAPKKATAKKTTAKKTAPAKKTTAKKAAPAKKATAKKATSDD